MAGNIAEFDAGNLSLRPTETGVEARAGTARRIGMFSNQQASAEDLLARETSRLASQTQQLGSETSRLGEEKGAAAADFGRRLGSSISAAGDVAMKFAEHQDLSRAAPAFARLTMNATERWNNIAKAADPNNPTVARDFLDSLDADLNKFKDNGFLTENGQKWAEAHTDALRQHMAEKTQADMATLAGHAAVTNQQQTINSLSNTVRSDPSSLDFSLAALKSGTEGMISSSPNLTGVQASAARSEILQHGAEAIVKSAAMGYIEKTGQIPPWASDPKYAPYINGAELKTFEQASKYYKRLGDSETKAARQQRDYEAKADFNQKVNALEAATMPRNIGDKPQLPDNYWQAMRDLATHPGAAFEPGRLKTMVENGERITERLNKPEPLARVSHAATVDLLSRMHNGQMSTNEDIYKAYGEGKLSDSDFNFLNREFKEAKTPEGANLDRDRATFFKQYAGAIVGGAGYDPVNGSPKLYAAEMDARRIEGDLRKKGMDPHLAYDPSSEYFIGKPANISKYQGSLQQDLSTRAATPPKSVNLTGDGNEITGIETKDLPPISRDAPRIAGNVYMTPAGKMKWTGTGWVKPESTISSPKFGNSLGLDEADSGEPDWSKLKQRFSDFRKSENVEDRRGESQIINKIKQTFLGDDAMSDREFAKWASEQPTQVMNALSKQLGLLDLEKSRRK